MRGQVVFVSKDFVTKVTWVLDLISNPDADEVAHRGHGGHLRHSVDVMMT